jgi:prepilin-type N-terminal cleavage/methylation domain-containing protein
MISGQRKGQRVCSAMAGFTLIEIIAVLVILAILASVAIPRAFDFRAEARATAANAALASGATTLTQLFAKWIVDNPAGGTSAEELARLDGVALGEFSMNLVLKCGLEQAYVEVTGGPSWWPADGGAFAGRLFDARTSFSAEGGGSVLKRTYTICE